VRVIGALPGPNTGTFSPAAETSLGPTRGTVAARPPIFKKSRRETSPEEGGEEPRSGLRPSSSLIDDLRGSRNPEPEDIRSRGGRSDFFLRSGRCDDSQLRPEPRDIGGENVLIEVTEEGIVVIAAEIHL